MFKHETLLT